MVDSTQNTSNATFEVPDDKRNEEAIFVRMLSEFNNGISEIFNAHNKLTLQLQGMDDINIENLTTGERVAAKLVEELDKCEELMSFLNDRLQTYDDVLNKVEESMENIMDKASTETAGQENAGKLFSELEDYARSVTQTRSRHSDLLQQPNSEDQIIEMRQLLNEHMESRMSAYKSFKASKKKRIGVLPMIGDFNDLVLVYEKLFKDCACLSDLEIWIIKLCYTIIDCIEAAATRSKRKYPPKLVRFENYMRLNTVLSGFHNFDALFSMRQLIKKKCVENLNPSK